MSVEVAFATAARQIVLALQVSRDATVEQAIRRSGILRKFPQIDLSVHPVGIFGERVALNAPLTPGDRIEIYRPLSADPKQARRQRARRCKRRASV
ncbi:MAG: RnfH family protein [Burkholderiales bacterium]|nr:RnfH family protein [Burkholderiales bacterium]